MNDSNDITTDDLTEMRLAAMHGQSEQLDPDQIVKIKTAAGLIRAIKGERELSSGTEFGPTFRDLTATEREILDAAGIQFDPIHQQVKGRTDVTFEQLPERDVIDERTDLQRREDHLNERLAEENVKRLKEQAKVDTWAMLELERLGIEKEKAAAAEAEQRKAEADEILSSRQKQIDRMTSIVEAMEIDASYPLTMLSHAKSVLDGLQNPWTDPESLTASKDLFETKLSAYELSFQQLMEKRRKKLESEAAAVSLAMMKGE